ncbi:MAG: nucleoside monophosphate kinase [Mycoplasmataceae bacterium]|jgi:adenylate kinase|nr:nucleoside monophosphate kinase [Mycoplasmataceae bacterium]
MVISIVGSTGSGKGLICDYLTKKYPATFEQINVGNIVKSEIKNDTEAGMSFMKSFRKGEMVDNDILTDLIIEKFNTYKYDEKKIILFNGYPCCVQQAELLDSTLHFDYLFYLKANYFVTRLRANGRRKCMACGRTTNTTFDKTARTGVCSYCGAVLAVRVDGHPEALKNKHREFKRNMKHILNYFEGRKCIVHANFDQKTTLHQFLIKLQNYFATVKVEKNIDFVKAESTHRIVYHKN